MSCSEAVNVQKQLEDIFPVFFLPIQWPTRKGLMAPFAQPRGCELAGSSLVPPCRDMPLGGGQNAATAFTLREPLHKQGMKARLVSALVE